MRVEPESSLLLKGKAIMSYISKRKKLSKAYPLTAQFCFHTAIRGFTTFLPPGDEKNLRVGRKLEYTYTPGAAGAEHA
jgi:hypothetical protein